MMRHLGVLSVVIALAACKDSSPPVAAKPDAAAIVATTPTRDAASPAPPPAADAAAAPTPALPTTPGKISAIGYKDASKRATLKQNETTYLGGVEPSARWEHATGTVVDLIVIIDEMDDTKARFVAVHSAGETDLGPFLPVTAAEPTIFWREHSPTELVAGADDEQDHALRLTWDGAAIAVAERWTGDRVDAESPAWVRAAFKDR